MKIRLAENFRAPFYAPIYALRALDLPAREGVTLQWLPARPPGTVFAEVQRGDVDLTWGGPIRVMKDRDATPVSGASLSCFGAIVSRDPFYLVGTPEWQGHKLSDLARARLAVVSEVPTPWLCLQEDFREAGIEITSCSSVVTGLSMEQQLRSLKRGEVDVVQLCEPFVSRALADRSGVVVYAACERGPTLYTTFISSLAGVARHEAAFCRLTVALGHVQRWITTHCADELTRLIAPFFMEVPRPVLRDAISRYRDAQIWGQRPAVSRAGFNRLARSLCSTRYLITWQSYESCVLPFARSDDS